MGSFMDYLLFPPLYLLYSFFCFILLLNNVISKEYNFFKLISLLISYYFIIIFFTYLGFEYISKLSNNINFSFIGFFIGIIISLILWNTNGKKIKNKVNLLNY